MFAFVPFPFRAVCTILDDDIAWFVVSECEVMRDSLQSLKGSLKKTCPVVSGNNNSRILHRGVLTKYGRKAPEHF